MTYQVAMAAIASLDVKRARDARSRKFALLEHAREITTRAGGRVCMYSGGGPGAGSATPSIAVTATGSAHVSGVKRCASSWACPTCAPVVGQRRADQINDLVDRWVTDLGGSVFFVTATLSHDRYDSLADVLGRLQDAWSSTFKRSDRWAWFAGQVRTIEVTHGENGWHPHIHSLVFVEPGEDVGGALWALRFDWGAHVAAAGGVTDVHSHACSGWDVRNVRTGSDVAGYLTKVDGGWSAGHEVARQDSKAGRASRRSPFEILSDSSRGASDSTQLFREYEAATKGRKRILVSRKLTERLALPEASDEDLVEVAPDDAVVLVCTPAPGVWDRLVRAGFLGRLISDVVEAAADRAGWPWPPEWLSTPGEQVDPPARRFEILDLAS